MLIFICSTVLYAQLSDSKKLILSEGTYFIESIEDANGLPGVRAMFEIDGTKEEVWQMINDFENFKQIYGGNVDSLKVHRHDEKGAIVEFWSDAVIRKIHFTLERKFLNSNTKLTWEKISGDLKIIKGGWELVDSYDKKKTILIYRTFIKFGGIVPTKLLRAGAKRKAKDMIRDTRDWISENRYLYQ